MPRASSRTWIVVADGMRARFFSWSRGTRGLRPAIAFDLFWPDSQGHARDLNSRKPGSTFSSGRGGRRHVFEPRHDYHKLAKHAFAATVAQVLDTAGAQDQFDRLIVVAPRRSLGELRMLLSDRVLRLLWLEVAKDLTRTSPAELWARLRTYFGPTR